MSWALIALILTDIIKYGPVVITILQNSITVEQEINTLAPDLLPNIAKLISSLVPHVDGAAVISSALLQFNKPAPGGMPGYAPDGSVTTIGAS